MGAWLKLAFAAAQLALEEWRRSQRDREEPAPSGPLPRWQEKRIQQQIDSATSFKVPPKS
jgi:hypothetical protein